jgi:hypothetical protein
VTAVEVLAPSQGVWGPPPLVSRNTFQIQLPSVKPGEIRRAKAFFYFFWGDFAADVALQLGLEGYRAPGLSPPVHVLFAHYSSLRRSRWGFRVPNSQGYCKADPAFSRQSGPYAGRDRHWTHLCCAACRFQLRRALFPDLIVGGRHTLSSSASYNLPPT